MAIAIPCLRCRATAHADENAQSLACPSCGLAMPPPGAAAWLVSRAGGQPFGPYTAAQLAGHVSTRMVQPTDNVWHEGAPGWVAVSELSALTAAAPAQPPQAPQPPQPAAAAGQPPGSAYGGQPQAGQPYGQPAAGQPYGGQPAAGQPYGGAPYAGQPQGGQPYAGQPGYADPYGPYGPGPYGGAPAMSGGGINLHLKRAFDWNLRHLQVDPQEEARLAARNIHDENARRYLVWRRSVLLVITVPMAVISVLAMIDLFTNLYNNGRALSALGVIYAILRTALVFVLPVTTFMAARVWDDQRKSRRILLIGWLITLAGPLLLALLPFTWMINTAGVNASQIAQLNSSLALLGAMQAYVTLMPVVLSLIPGVLRGCLRIKALLPQAILPGLFLVAATPLYVLLFMVIFTTVNQVIGNFVLVLGVLALAGSAVVYLFYTGTFMRPLRSEEEFAKIGTAQLNSTIVMTIGIVLLLLWALTVEIAVPGPDGVRMKGLVGTSELTSIMRPWDPQLLQFPLEYIGRSLFTTVVVADLFMLMNVAMWRNSKVIEGTPEGQNYDRIMANIEEAGGAGIISGNTTYRGAQ
jgi:hypothetical protein